MTPDSPFFREFQKPSAQMGRAFMSRESMAPKMAYGYPVATAKELGLEDFFRSRPDVAGMAWGGGENGSDPSEPRTVVHNPFNQYMADPKKRDALYKVEAARHAMASNPVPKFTITPALQRWREANFKKGDPYREDDNAFRETVISRIMVGDSGENGDMPFEDEPRKIADAFSRRTESKPTLVEKTLDRRKKWWDLTP